MTIAAVLDHRLAEAQRLGLRVKVLKVTRDEYISLRFQCLADPPLGALTDPESSIFRGYPLAERHAPTL